MNSSHGISSCARMPLPFDLTITGNSFESSAIATNLSYFIVHNIDSKVPSQRHRFVLLELLGTALEVLQISSALLSVVFVCLFHKVL